VIIVMIACRARARDSGRNWTAGRKKTDMYWIWTNEPMADDKAMISGVLPVVIKLNLEFDKGVPLTADEAFIEIDRDADFPPTVRRQARYSFILLRLSGVKASAL
jgi:hypothetical protein